MAETLTSYSTIVKNDVDDSSSKANLVIDRFVKETYFEILRDTYKYINGVEEYILSLTSGQQEITTIPEFLEIDKVLYKTNGNYSELKQISKSDYYAREFNNADGTPSKWFLNGRGIKLDRGDSNPGTILIVYVPMPSELTTQESEIPDAYTEVVRLGGTYRFLAYDKDPSTPEYKGLYEEAKSKMLRDLKLSSGILTPKFMGR